MSFVTIDVETSNSKPESICQIGMAKYINGKLVDTFESYVNPDDTFSRKNVEIHGITSENVKNAPSIFELYGMIFKFIGALPVVSHTNFDKKAMYSCFEKFNLPLPEWAWVDSSFMVRATCKKWSQSGYGLNNVCSEWGYEFKHHDALEDAKACGYIVKTILREHNQDISHWIDNKTKPKLRSSNYPNRIRARKGDSNGKFSGMALCFTGELTMSRSEVADLASKHGFDVKAGVSKKLSYLVVGTQDLNLLSGQMKSSKHRKAEELIEKGTSLQIITENEFIRLIQL